MIGKQSVAYSVALAIYYISVVFPLIQYFLQNFHWITFLLTSTVEMLLQPIHPAWFMDEKLQVVSAWKKRTAALRLYGR